MPVDNSRLKGFYKLEVEERRAMIAKIANLSDEQVEALASNGELDDSAADRSAPLALTLSTVSTPI